MKACDRLDLDSRLALRPAEAAKALGISEKAFRRFMHEIPCVRRGRIRLFRRETLDGWLRRNETAEEDRASEIADEISHAISGYDTEKA